jgi:hypothetical protein
MDDDSLELCNRASSELDREKLKMLLSEIIEALDREKNGTTPSQDAGMTSSRS